MIDSCAVSLGTFSKALARCARLRPILGPASRKWTGLSWVPSCCLWLAVLGPGYVHAGSGPLGIDSELALDQNGIWARQYQTGLANGVIAVEVAGALWFGNDNKLGHTFWQTIDATAVSAIGAQLLKYAFSRARPSQGGDPNQWFKGRCCQSFRAREARSRA